MKLNKSVRIKNIEIIFLFVEFDKINRFQFCGNKTTSSFFFNPDLVRGQHREGVSKFIPVCLISFSPLQFPADVGLEGSQFHAGGVDLPAWASGIATVSSFRLSRAAKRIGAVLATRFKVTPLLTYSRFPLVSAASLASLSSLARLASGLLKQRFRFRRPLRKPQRIVRS